MADGYPVGRSSFTDGSSTSPFGKVQTVATSIAARQVASLCYEFDTTFPGALERGDRLTVNEGIRPRPRQIALQADYRAGRGPLAAYCTWGPPPVFTSTHDESRGSGLDFGITMADGRNRAMTAAEAAWVDRNGPRRGILPTGNSFSRPESWHKNAGYAYSVAPIVGVNQPGEPFYTVKGSGTAAAPRMIQGDTMLAFDINGDLFAVSPGRIRHCTTTREFDLAVASVPGNVRQKTDPTSFRNILRTNGIPVAAADPVWITLNADADSDGHTWSAVGSLRAALVTTTRK